MATKTDLINLAIKKKDVAGMLNLCISSKQMEDICTSDVRIHTQIKKYFEENVGDDPILSQILLYLIFKVRLTNQTHIKDIIDLVHDVLDYHSSTSLPEIKELIKLLRKLETKKHGSWIYVYPKYEMDKLFDIDGDDIMKISTNNPEIVKMMFETYFKVESESNTQMIYKL